MGEVVCLEASPAVRSWKMTSEDDTSSACSGRGSKVRELRVLKQQMSRAPPLSLSSKSDLTHERSRNTHPDSAPLGPVAKQDKAGASHHMGRASSQETEIG